MIESFTPGAVQRMGLDYEHLREINPGLVMVSTCLMGQTGPARKMSGYGYHAGAIAGYYEVTGWPDRTPSGPWTAYTDTIAPRFVSSVLAAALDRRRRTGEGCYIDLAQLEAALHFLGPEILDYQVNGRSVTRIGNRSRFAAPQGCYPCAGEDNWVAVAVDTDEQWRALAGVVGCAQDYASNAERLAAHDAIDEVLSAWTSERDPAAAARELQAAGVPAGVVQRSSDLLKDPQYVHRGFLPRVRARRDGPRPLRGSPVPDLGLRQRPPGTGAAARGAQLPGADRTAGDVGRRGRRSVRLRRDHLTVTTGRAWRQRRAFPLLFAWATLALGGVAWGQPGPAVTYVVTFEGNWTIASTPGGVVPGAHFTTLIGGIHDARVSFWRSGETASPGIEAMAETGATGPLRAEVVASPHAVAVVQQRVAFGGTGGATFRIEVTASHPLVTLTSMIGPSPDWFVGVAGLSLLEGGQTWYADRQVDLFPYDAGTEDGIEFSLSNPDTRPRGVITGIRGTGKFSDEPMARLRFVLQLGRVTGVTVTAGEGRLVVAWNAVPGADGYRVQWRSGAEAFDATREEVVAGGNVTSRVIAGLEPGIEYSVRVVATRGRRGGTSVGSRAGNAVCRRRRSGAARATPGDFLRAETVRA